MKLLPVLIGLAVIGSATRPPPSEQQAVFSTRVEAVRVDVLVTKGGQPVRGLGPADFEVRDNGVLQEVDIVSADELPLNVALALDLSDSVSGTRLRDLRNAGRLLLGALNERDRAALVTFGFAVAPARELSSDRRAVEAALETATGGGQTALIDGCFAGLMLGASEVGRSLLLVFSDGVDTASYLSAPAVIATAGRADVVTYGVVAGSKRRQSFLRDLATATGGDVLEVGSTSEVGATFLRLLNEYRQRYLLSYSPRGVDKGGWHQLAVRVMGRSVTVRARTGYLAGS